MYISHVSVSSGEKNPKPQMRAVLYLLCILNLTVLVKTEGTFHNFRLYGLGKYVWYIRISAQPVMELLSQLRFTKET